MYSIVLGDVFSLKAAAFDMSRVNPEHPDDPAAILFWPGTRATVVEIEQDSIFLQFPDGSVIPHNAATILYAFNRIEDDEVVISKVTTGFGTPPPGLVPFMPPEADWRRNYRYKVYVELQDRGLKTAVCPRCYGDLGERAKRNEQGLLKCEVCNIYVIPLNTEVQNVEEDTIFGVS